MDIWEYGTPSERRERVLKAIRHEEADFVPYNFHAIPLVYTKLQEHYGLKDSLEVADFIGNHVVKIGSDFNYNPWAGDMQKVSLTPSGGPVETNLDQAGALHADEFGCVWDRSSGMPHPVAYPLAEGHQLLESYAFPDPYRQGRFEQAGELAARWRGKAFIFAKLGMALFERAWSIRGMAELLMDMVERPEFVDELLDRILYEWNLPIIEQQLAIGVDGFYFADDWGAKTGMIFSPAMWRRFIKPRLATIYQRCRQAGVYVGQHSDGNILEIFPDLIEIGLDIFNPLEPAAMDPPEMKRRFGSQVTFYGGVDVERTLPFGTPEEVRAEVRERAATLGKGGGYILQTSHTILWDVPLENLTAYVEAVRALAGLGTPRPAAAQAQVESA
jgi:uroporphyrinogen decarboxylase